VGRRGGGESGKGNWGPGRLVEGGGNEMVITVGEGGGGSTKRHKCGGQGEYC